MAYNNTLNPSFLDWNTRLDPTGQVARVIEILNQYNGILEDMTATEGNLPTGHRTTIRSGLPLPTWRRLYGGVQPSKSTTVQVTEACGMLEAYSEVDKAMADLNGNSEEFLLSEALPHIEAMSQEVARSTFYGDESVLPAGFTGLGPRYGTVNPANANNAFNVINFLGNSGGVGTPNQYVSAYLVVWSPETVTGIFPKGSQAGLQINHKGQVTVENSDSQTAGSGRFEAYRTHFRWDLGLSVRDWRYVARVANIDVTSTAGGLLTVAGQKALVTSMIQAAERIPNLNAGRAVWYLPRAAREALRLGMVSNIGQNLTWDTVAGQRVMFFDGIPVKRVDALNTTNEAAQVGPNVSQGELS